LEFNELYASLGMALGVGLLVGLQREQSTADDPPEQKRFVLGGIRTYAIFALSGALSALLARQFGPWVIVVTFAGLMTPLAIAYADDVRAGRERGITSETAFISVFLLGALALSPGVIPELKHRLLIVASVGVALTSLLALKGPLHEIVAKISSDDIYATIKFAVVAIIVLPILPDVGYGPHEKLKVFNPYKIGWMVVLIAGISFTGYLAIRILGPGKGLGITGLLGGLASSTAVTLAFSGRSKQEPAIAHACALGVVLANSIMPLRVIASVAIVNPALTRSVAVPMGAISLAGFIAALVIYVRGEKTAAESGGVKLTNPFKLASAVKFGLLFAAILFVCKLATLPQSNAGIYVAGLLAGTTDVDAITLSVANLVKEGTLVAQAAATTILLAVASNSIVKMGMAISLGGPGFRNKVGVTFGAMLACGAAGVAVMWIFGI